ncbi:hypothetical protein ABZ070_25595 [Streptomyces sp. NPDC006283]|uniref:hypothetical protein n=1 Tax=Streptomyces sp. NPDC006283 TaxID=3156741 RepID=UPI0033AE4265
MRTRNALALGAAAALVASAVISGSAATAAAMTTRTPLAAAPAGPSAVFRAEGRAEGGAEVRSEIRSGSSPADRAPTCGKASDPDFPIKTRIHGGPATVRAGAGSRPWSVDLTNTTREACHRIHPVLILTARDRGLTADRVTLEFYDETTARWRPVTLERTTEDEIVGAFDDGFLGFVVPAGGTVTVRTRLSFAAGTTPNTVTVNAAIVQRQGDDGDWVGESGDYRFAVVEGDGGEAGDGEEDSEQSAEPTPARSAAEAATGTATAAKPTPAPAEKSPHSTYDQLATTGSGSLARVGVGTAVILLSAGLLVFVARRLRSGAGRH